FASRSVSPFSCYAYWRPRALRSFPTRRSSDLAAGDVRGGRAAGRPDGAGRAAAGPGLGHDRGVRRDVGAVPLDPLRRPGVLRVRLGVDAAGVRGAGGPPGLARGRAAAADDPLPAL